MTGDDKPYWQVGKNILWHLGPTTAAFLAMLAVMFGWLPSPMLTAMQEGVKGLQDNRLVILEIQQALSTTRTEVAAHAADARRESNMSLRAQRQICRNTAKTPAQNEKCDELY